MLRFLRNHRRVLIRSWRVAAPLAELLATLAETFHALGAELDDDGWKLVADVLEQSARDLRRLS